MRTILSVAFICMTAVTGCASTGLTEQELQLVQAQINANTIKFSCKDECTLEYRDPRSQITFPQKETWAGAARDVGVALVGQAPVLGMYGLGVRALDSLTDLGVAGFTALTGSGAVTNVTNTDITQTNTDITQTNTDITQTNTDITQTNMDITRTNTDITQTNMDITRTNTDITRTNTDITQTTTQTDNSTGDYSGAASGNSGQQYTNTSGRINSSDDYTSTPTVVEQPEPVVHVMAP